MDSDRFIRELKGLLGSDSIVEEFLSGLDFLLQRAPELVGVPTPNQGIYLTFGQYGGVLVAIYYQFNAQKVYRLSAR